MDYEYLVELLIAILGITIFLGIVATGALHLYIANLRITEILEHLKNCPLVDPYRHCAHTGLHSKIRAIQDIASFLNSPEFLIEVGALSTNDIKYFPKNLKKLLITAHYLSLAFLGGMIVLAVALQILDAVRHSGSLIEVKLGEQFSVSYTPYLPPLLLEILCIFCIFMIGTQYKHAAARYADTINRHLNNCNAIISRRSLLCGGAFGRIVFSTCVAALLAHSRLFIKTGALEASDVKSFPVSIRTELVTRHYWLMASFAGLAVSIVALKGIE